MEKSKYKKINKTDWIKAFWMFLYSTIIGVVGDAVIQAVTVAIETGSVESFSFSQIHWKEIGMGILLAVVAYLKKQFLTNSNGEILTKENE